MVRPLIMLAAIIGLVAVASTEAIHAASNSARLAFARPGSIPFPPHAPFSPQIATLGKMLFFDPRVSGAQNMSCASCHNPSFGWETPVGRAIGSLNSELPRHAPTVLNGAWIPHFYWDGRAQTLEEQAAGPIEADAEMNAEFHDVVTRLAEVEEYAFWFDRLFPGTGISRDTILIAIATYERTIVSGWAPFDDWVEGDETAISESAKRGFALFTGRAHCANCHTGWNFSDNRFHDIGLYTEDIGRAEIEPTDPAAMHAFKTPGLRNITLRAPFMHGGQLDDLESVMYHYASGGAPRPSLSPLMKPFELSDADLNDLIAFLETLTERETRLPTPILPAN